MVDRIVRQLAQANENLTSLKQFAIIQGSRISASGPNFCGTTKRSEYSLSQIIVLPKPKQ